MESCGFFKSAAEKYTTYAGWNLYMRQAKLIVGNIITVNTALSFISKRGGHLNSHNNAVIAYFFIDVCMQAFSSRLSCELPQVRRVFLQQAYVFAITLFQNNCD